MFHRKKRENSPVSAEDLLAEKKANPKKVVIHGRNVWAEGVMYLFDEPTGEFVLPETFARMERERAESRRLGYPNGRRKGSRRHWSSACGFDRHAALYYA